MKKQKYEMKWADNGIILKDKDTDVLEVFETGVGAVDYEKKLQSYFGNELQCLIMNVEEDTNEELRNHGQYLHSLEVEVIVKPIIKKE